MAKFTKKQIREAIKPISHTLHKSHDGAKSITIGSLVVTGTRLYNAPGCVGPVWNASYTAYLNGQQMLGGNTSEIIDNIYRALNNPEWFKEHCARLWGDRLKAA